MTSGNCPRLTAHSPGGQLLLAALRSRHDPEASRQVAELTEALVDWPSYLRAVRNQRLTLFLRDGLVRSGAYDRLPQVVREELDANLRDAGAFVLLARQALEVAIEALGDVPHLVLRGPVLGELLYGADILRPFTDLDILVRACDWERLWGVAQSLSAGRPFRMKWLLDPDLDEFVVLSSEELTRSEATQLSQRASLSSLDVDILPDFTVEFKTALSRGYRARDDLSTAWPRRREVTWLNLRVALPPWELVLPHIADHAAGHFEPGSKLAPLLDVDGVVRTATALDWDRCAARIRKLRIELPCLVAFRAAQRFLGTAFPPGWLESFTLSPIARRILALVSYSDPLVGLWGPLTPYAPLREVLRRPGRWLALRPALQARKLLRALLPSQAYVRYQYGRSGLVGYVAGYLEHWSRLPLRVSRRKWLRSRVSGAGPP